jgi:hypothetical protein
MPVFQSDPFDAGNDEDDSSGEDEEKVPARDKIFAEWLKIKRQREKFVCEFRNAVIHINGKDFVLKTISAEINY